MKEKTMHSKMFNVFAGLALFSMIISVRAPQRPRRLTRPRPRRLPAAPAAPAPLLQPLRRRNRSR